MNQKEIRDLIEFLIEKDIAEFELERGDVKIKVKRPTAVSHFSVAAEPQQQVIPQTIAKPSMSALPQAPAAAPPATMPSAAESEADLQIVNSPIVGTFYESPSPGSPPFVKVGDTVSVGQVLCIVEAMKLMNEIESDFAGVVVKRHIENGQPVEYGQAIFAIRPA